MNLQTLYTDLTAKIARTRRLEHRIAVESSLLNALAVTVCVWLLTVSLEAVFRFGMQGRMILYWSAVGISAASIAFFLTVPLCRWLGWMRGQDDDTIARRVGTKIPEVGDKLVNTLQLFRTTRAEAAIVGYSSELVEASIAVRGEPLRNYDYTVIVERQRRKRALLFLLVSLLVSGVLLTGFTTTYRDAWHRLVNYNQEFLPPVPPAPFSLEITPHDKTVLRGDSVSIIIRATGIPPRTVRLVLQSEGQPTADSLELREDSVGVFRHTISGINTNIRFFAVSGQVRTPAFTLRIVDHPELQSLRVTLTPPSYIGRGPEQLPENSGDVSGIRGTSVSIRATATLPVTKAWIVQIFPRNLPHAKRDSNATLVASTEPMEEPTPIHGYDTVRIPMSVNGTALSGGFRLTRDGEYFISLVSADGLTNQSPVHYTMSVSGDAPPNIALVQPGSAQVTIDPTMIMPTRVRIGDDYGFSRLRLMWRISASKYSPPQKDFREERVPIPQGSPSQLDVPYIWNMGKTNIAPEDEVEFYYEVFDNDIVTGPKSARTETVKIKFPSLEEALKQAEKTQAQASVDLDKVLKQAQETKKQMDELNRELMKQLAQRKSQPNWQEQQKMQELMQKNEEMQKKLEQIAENLESVQEKLQEAKAISPETMKKYMELQKLFQDIKNPDLLKSMQDLQKAMEKMSPEELTEAMKNYKFNEEQFRQSIERTMKILQRMQAEQKVDELMRRADELQQRNSALDQQMKNFDPKDDAAQKQLADRLKEMAKNADQMKQKTDELAKQMKELGEDMPQKEMQDAQQSLQQDDPQEQMEGASQEMEKGDQQDAQQKMQQANQSLEKYKQKMQQVKKKMQENSRQATINTMKKALRDMLELSKEQEELKNKTNETMPNSQRFREMAQQQSEMQQDMQNIANSMMGLAQKSFAVTPEMGRELGDAIRNMQNATQSLEQRNGSGASQEQGQAMGAMNKAAMQMQQALSQMQGQGQQGQGQGGMGMSFQQRLGQIAGQQQMLNMAMGQQQGEGQQGQGKQGKNGKQGENGEEGEGEENDPNGKPSSRKLQRLARQQNEVKKSLQQLNEESKQSGGTRKNMAGDLDRAVKEMEEVVSDMQNGNVTPETAQRQERILSRLLDAMKSQRERDYEKERESKSGQDVARKGPGELQFNTPEQRAQQLRDILQGRGQGYSKDYEQLIRRYFETVGRGAGN